MNSIVFNRKYNNELHQAWEDFINNRPISSKVVRKEILDEWKECKARNIDPYINYPATYIPDKTLQELREQNRLMCDTALPFMKRIYETIPGPSSIVALYDRNEYMLQLVQSQEYNEYSHKNGFIPGVEPNSIYPHIMEVHICRRIKKMIWCFGEEHFSQSNKDWACSAAPIFDAKGTLQGILTISIKATDAHWHTLGMALASATAIENEMLKAEAYQKAKRTSNQLTAAIESMPQGILLVNESGTIIHANSYAQKILHTEDTITGMDVGQALAEKNRFFSKPPFATVREQAFTFNTKEGPNRYYVTTKSFQYDEGDTYTVIMLKEMDSAREFVNSATGSKSHYRFSDIIGSSSKIRNTISLAEISATNDSNVLIIGPSGTGKELFAHSIHTASARKNGPFISVNCGALPANLVESELFGYEDGAFTGARKNGQIGKFELANNGTLFLDEIGEMPLSVQASILRAIESKEVVRIGGTHTTKINIRIIAATNRNLEAAIKKKEFREDLFYRLNVLRLNIPALRERKEDIIPLTENFLQIYCAKAEKDPLSLSDAAYDLLMQYDWPGNVRELENTIERAVMFCTDPRYITPELIQPFINVNQTVPSDESSYSDIKKMDDIERQHLIDTLKETKGDVTKTAEILAIPRRTLYRKFEKYDIDYKKYRI